MSNEQHKAKVQRSKAYPSINLQEAIEKAKILYSHEGRYEMHPDVAIEHWGYAKASSPGQRAIAALRHFGLIESQGLKDDRRIKLSALGLLLAIDDDTESEERVHGLQEAALNPELFRAMWEEKGGSRTSDANLRRSLLLDGDVNKNVVDEVIACFRATVEFAKLSENGILQTEGTDKIRDKEGDKPQHSPPPPVVSISQDPKGSRPMPATTLQDRSDLDLPIPLIEGGQATLRIPVPLSEEDYEYLTGMLDNMLKGMKKALTRRPKQNTSDDDDEF